MNKQVYPKTVLQQVENPVDFFDGNRKQHLGLCCEISMPHTHALEYFQDSLFEALQAKLLSNNTTSQFGLGVDVFAQQILDSIHNTPESKSQPKKEERKMSQVQINPSLLPDLKALAGAGVQDEFSDLQGIPDELKDALAEQVATEKRDKYARMAKTLLEILRASDVKKKTLVEELRAVRARERDLLAKIGNLQEATNTAKESSNYLPLVLMLDPALRPFVSEAELATAKNFIAKPATVATKRPGKRGA